MPRAGRVPKRESQLLAEVRLFLGQRQDIMAWRMNTGLFRSIKNGPGDKPRVIRSNPTGTPDLIGVQAREVDAVDMINPDSFQPHEKKYTLVYGQAFAVETKTPEGRQRESQIRWQAAWEARGGIYILATSLEDVARALNWKRIQKPFRVKN